MTRHLTCNSSANLTDIGDGVINLELTTKQNVLDGGTFDAIEFAIDLIGQGTGQYQAMTIHSDAENFAAGADVSEFLTMVEARNWDGLAERALRGQVMLRALRNAPFPTVTALKGAALGGGCELVMSSSAAIAMPEIMTGLVEASVGIIPAWGGVCELLRRHTIAAGPDASPMQPVTEVFDKVLKCKVANTPEQAKAMFFLRQDDTVLSPGENHLHKAKTKALSMVKTYVPPEPITFPAVGTAGQDILSERAIRLREAERISDHDLIIAKAIINVVTAAGTETAFQEEHVLEQEILGALGLFRTDETLARIKQLLGTGKE